MNLKFLLSILFFISGFCGLLYQVVWLRLAMSEFGVVSPVISAVLSVFMLGRGLGSWWGGRLSQYCRLKWKFSPILLYALTELVIGAGALLVPILLRNSAKYLLQGSALDSSDYLLRSFLAIFFSLLPCTLAMGLPFPLMMGFIQERWNLSKGGFSFLYLANVVGAAAGALAAAFILIELNGFHDTLLLGAKLNFFVAALSLFCWVKWRGSAPSESAFDPPAFLAKSAAPSGLLFFLFLSGFVSMGLEVVWNRMFSGRLGNGVYAFAIILSIYLLATAAGTLAYRAALVRFRSFEIFRFYPFLIPAVLVGMLFTDPFPSWFVYALMVTIVPVSFMFGALTPAAMDLFALGDERRAGFAYAVNISGCILGPLVAAYAFLPNMDEVWGVAIFSLFLLPGCVMFTRRAKALMLSAAMLVALTIGSRTFFRSYSESEYGAKLASLHDHTAMVSIHGADMRKSLVVNHVAMTKLTTITKMMVHFPLALLEKKPESVLVICFGMGTSYRSALSWGIQAKVVELVPSVPKFFPFFHSDAEALVQSHLGEIVIDDGRRYLQRVRESFDLITLDPPPPIHTAASGMLYSVEFYEQAKSRLRPEGILQQWWYDSKDAWLFESALRSIVKVFPHVMVFPSVEGWGYHILASQTAIRIPGVNTIRARMPESAVRDMREWEGNTSAENLLSRMLDHGRRPWEFSGFELDGPMITDDFPLNEYFFVRRGISSSDLKANQ